MTEIIGEPLLTDTELTARRIFRFELAQSLKALDPNWVYDSDAPIIDKHAEMISKMQEVRIFHSPEYVCKCLHYVRSVSSYLKDKHLVIAAILFHTSGYVPGDKRSTERSCKIAREFYTVKIPDKLETLIRIAQADWVEESFNDHDMMYVRDIVNHQYGLPYEEFRKGWGKILQEFNNAKRDPVVFKRFSAKRLREILERYGNEGIYRTQYFFEAFEEQAKANIEQILEGM